MNVSVSQAQGIEAEILVCPAHEGHTRLERIARFLALFAKAPKMRPKKADKNSYFIRREYR
jgi:hypothetical protein